MIDLKTRMAYAPEGAAHETHHHNGLTNTRTQRHRLRIPSPGGGRGRHGDIPGGAVVSNQMHDDKDIGDKGFHGKKFGVGTFLMRI